MLSIVVVERKTCGQPNCAGLELYRFKLADGSVRGPFVAVPVYETLAGNAIWVEQRLVVPGSSAGTQIRP